MIQNDVNRSLSVQEKIDNRHLELGKSSKRNAITQIKATLLKSAREFFENDGWLEVTPIPAISTLSGACEDFSTLFSLEYFGKKAFLIQTGQQHLEAYIGPAINKVYTFNQSYRAETEAQERRLTSFLLVEAEAAYYDLNEIQSIQERLLYKLCADTVLWRHSELKQLGADIHKLLDLKIPLKRIKYREAITILNQLGPEELKLEFGHDLKAKHEKALATVIGQPFFVSHYPGAIKFFNMKDDPDDPQLVLSSDLLLPGVGEVIGSSVREDNRGKLSAKLEQFAQDEKRRRDLIRFGIQSSEELVANFQWYLALREGNVPHAGFGLGFERLVQWICDLSNITEAAEYPRNRDHLSP